MIFNLTLKIEILKRELLVIVIDSIHGTSTLR